MSDWDAWEQDLMQQMQEEDEASLLGAIDATVISPISATLNLQKAFQAALSAIKFGRKGDKSKGLSSYSQFLGASTWARKAIDYVREAYNTARAKIRLSALKKLFTREKAKRLLDWIKKKASAVYNTAKKIWNGAKTAGRKVRQTFKNGLKKLYPAAQALVRFNTSADMLKKAGKALVRIAAKVRRIKNKRIRAFFISRYVSMQTKHRQLMARYSIIAAKIGKSRVQARYKTVGELVLEPATAAVIAGAVVIVIVSFLWAVKDLFEKVFRLDKEVTTIVATETTRVPVIDPKTGKQMMRQAPVIDPKTGKQKIDPTTGEPMWKSEPVYSTVTKAVTTTEPKEPDILTKIGKLPPWVLLVGGVVILAVISR